MSALAAPLERRALDGWGLPSVLVAIASAVFVGALSALGAAAALFGLLAVCFGIVVLFRPLVGACVLTAVVPVVAGVKRGLPVPGFRLAEVAIVCIAFLILIRPRRGEPVRWGAFDWFALAYAVATAALGAFDLAHRGAAFSNSNVGTLFGPFQFFLLYRAVRTAAATHSARVWCLRLIVSLSIPVSALALAQEFGVPGVRAALDSATSITKTSTFAQYVAEGLGRATGPFDHPHTLGAYLMIVILLCVGLLLAGVDDVLPRWALAGTAAFALVAQLVTFTATPLLATVIGSIGLGFVFGRTRQVVAAIAVAVVLLGVAFGPSLTGRVRQQYSSSPVVQSATANPLVPSSLTYRYELWAKQDIPVMSGHWLTGYGPDVPPTQPGSIPWLYSENVYISLALRGGVPLLALFAALMYVLFVSARARARSTDGIVRVLANVVAIVVLLLVGMHMVEPYFVDVGMTHLLWGVCGLLLAADATAT